MLYFAYGSNMHPDQIRQWCPVARFVAIARLSHHRLAFIRGSTQTGYGVCSAVPAQGREVWGVVFEVAEDELACLDEHEGYRPGHPASANAYVRQRGCVCRDGGEHQPMEVWLYFANRQPNPPLPDAAYKRLIVEGARHWRLPATYQAELAQIEIALRADAPQPTRQ